MEDKEGKSVITVCSDCNRKHIVPGLTNSLRQCMSAFVAEKAQETFLAIRKLRKEMPRFTRAQKDELKYKEKELKDQWWDDVKPYMVKGKDDPPPIIPRRM